MLDQKGNSGVSSAAAALASRGWCLFFQGWAGLASSDLYTDPTSTALPSAIDLARLGPALLGHSIPSRGGSSDSISTNETQQTPLHQPQHPHPSPALSTPVLFSACPQVTPGPEANRVPSLPTAGKQSRR